MSQLPALQAIENMHRLRDYLTMETFVSVSVEL